MKFTSRFLILVFLSISILRCEAQLLHNTNRFTRQDTLRGSITPERSWWDVTWYGITVKPDYKTKTIIGSTDISFKVLQPGNLMQVDLQVPLEIQSVSWNNKDLHYKRDGNIYLVTFPDNLKKGTLETIRVRYSGRPREAVRPPWDGGWIWKTDRNGIPWMSVACQGLGASAWYPCKDHQSDEPDSAALTMVVPDTLVAVGNGRLRSRVRNSDGTESFTWVVKNSINNYNIIPYIGKYVNWTESFDGEKGQLDCSFWVLDNSLDSAKIQFRQAFSMLKCFEDWFGPYPFYEDGYKLVQSPHLGMEHQSAVAYGNGFRNGYLGSDLSGTGWGLKWDFILIHESGHEWFGNNITSKDLSDMWIHESFTNYSETIYTGYLSGREAGEDYVIGTRKQVGNKSPVIGPYNVNNEGNSGSDMYYKGGNMIHTIRHIINNDEVFKKILRGMNKTFYHQTVTTRQIEEFFSKQSGIELSKVFDQYLRTAHLPVLEYKATDNRLSYRWSNCVKGFNMPVKISMNGEKWLTPTEQWQSMNTSETAIKVDRNFYIVVKNVEPSK
ncbi:MAG: M1 family metallopeptidase [Chitinophagaceae bacterium]